MFRTLILASVFLVHLPSAFAAEWQCGTLKNAKGWALADTGFGVGILPANEDVADFVLKYAGEHICIKGQRLSGSADFLTYAARMN